MRSRFEDHRVRLFFGTQEFGPFAVEEDDFGSDIQIEEYRPAGFTDTKLDATTNGYTFSFRCSIPAGFDDPELAFEAYEKALKERNPNAGPLRIVETYRIPGNPTLFGHTYDRCQANYTVRNAERSARMVTISGKAEDKQRIQ